MASLQKGVEFCLVLFVHQLKHDYVFILLIECIALINFHILNSAYILIINPTCLCYINLLIYC